MGLPDREPLPGSGRRFGAQAHNLTVLHYAGDMKFSYEEDAYNPMNFAPVVNGWLEAYRPTAARLTDPASRSTRLLRRQPDHRNPGVRPGRVQR